jgi:hypothetical protein
MRLLKFVDSDAPQTGHGSTWDPVTNTLTLQKLRGGWQGVATPAPGAYWLIDETGKPVRLFEEVVVMRRVGTAPPRGISDEHVRDVDFRSRMGKQLESTRAEYGQTFKTAAAKAAAVNQEQKTTERLEKMKRERQEVAAQIERGEFDTQGKGGKKSRAEEPTGDRTAASAAAKSKKK